MYVPYYSYYYSRSPGWMNASNDFVHGGTIRLKLELIHHRSELFREF